MDQAKIYKFLEKTKKSRKNKKTTTDNPDGESVPATSGECDAVEDSDKVANEQDKLRKKVANLMKKQKMRKAAALVKRFDASRPWGQEGQAKVCNVSRFVHMSMKAIFTLHSNAVLRIPGWRPLNSTVNRDSLHTASGGSSRRCSA